MSKKPIKAPGAMLNTWMMDVKGTVVAMDTLIPKTTTIRFTSDLGHETLSLALEKDGLHISVLFEDVERVINAARKERERKQN